MIVSFPDGGAIISRSSDSSLKIDLSLRARSVAYRLCLTGEVIPDNNLKIGRSKLSGLYRAANNNAQTDLLLVVPNPAAPLGDFACAYLGYWLTAQARTLTHCAELATTLGQTLTGTEAELAGPAQSTQSAYLLAEARRGLSDADQALRQALTSISELEGGFATILGKSVPQPVKGPVKISPDIFEGAARDVLAEVGAACTKIAPSLQSAADNLQRTLATSPGFTIGQYQQSYATAVDTARVARDALLEVIALLRLEIASGKLPLVAWRVHNQVQELAENLRWGVLRGTVI
jgi:hypothetical protein